MTRIERLRPDPIPPIHPLPEHLASGQRALWYEDTKAILQVPWMGVVTMAYAHYPTFFGALWQGLRPLCESRDFVHAALDLRRFVETQTADLAPKSLVRDLTERGYGPREIDEIRNKNSVFSHGNQPYVLIAALARHLLEIGDMAGGRAAEPFDGRHAPDLRVPFLLMEAHHADAPTQALYEDIKATLGLPFVNTDYRAFARWPSYFALAWGDLKGIVGTPAHEAGCEAYHGRALALAQTLPNPGGLAPAALEAAAERDAPLDEILDVCRLFQHLLPGLAVNVAFFREQLA